MYLIDAVRGMAAAWAATAVTLVAIESCRFTQPVLPGDRVHVRATFTEEGRVLRGHAVLSTYRGTVAGIRVVFDRRAE